jgi:hypothetical protein
MGELLPTRAQERDAVLVSVGRRIDLVLFQGYEGSEDFPACAAMLITLSVRRRSNESGTSSGDTNLVRSWFVIPIIRRSGITMIIRPG